MKAGLLALLLLPAAAWSEEAPDFVPAAPSAGRAAPANDDAVWRAWFEEHHEPLDWKKVCSGPERVVFIADIHRVSELMDEITAHIPEIARAGITHFALEVFGDNKQQLLDGYAEDGSGAEEIREYLTTYKAWPKVREHFEMLDALRESGIRAVGVDLPSEAKIESKRDIGRAIEGGDGSDMDSYFSRDERMAGNIADVLEADPKARVFAFLGSMHGGRVSLNAAYFVLEGQGTHARTYTFANDGSKAERAIQALGLGDRRLFVPMGSAIADSFDGYLYFPGLSEATSRRRDPSERNSRPRRLDRGAPSGTKGE